MQFISKSNKILSLESLSKDRILLDLEINACTCRYIIKLLIFNFSSINYLKSKTWAIAFSKDLDWICILKDFSRELIISKKLL